MNITESEEKYVADAVFPYQLLVKRPHVNNKSDDMEANKMVEWCKITFNSEKWSMDNQSSTWYYVNDNYVTGMYAASPNGYYPLTTWEFHFMNEEDKILFALKWLS